ncbi:MAG: cysteine synthase [Candidatus Desulfovibrio kirbyi]|jgi:cysteine synthase B|uniref:cysteine synthase n=1 Tax=Candidatus Desulfovibrio kirbyi TaxID=2696086 RepID=A0A6L2R6G7_9BACT|nr:PLP-dependent cysteine synthase family protein [Desulfovibrio sp.]GFH63135.1 MAG: cysteine synthase [Candidatus Desulfovibrio kirbyi]
MSILDSVGNTPLLELKKIAAELDGIKLLAKAEFCNPSGSVKDRAAKAMLLDGLRSKVLTKEKIVIDATSGNTGIAYAMMGAALGLAVVLYMPANANMERKGMIARYGAHIVETDPMESSDGAYLAAKNAYESRPERYFYPDQYNNPVNAQAHYESTGVEIWEQSAYSVTHFIAGMGTSGTFTGVSRRLKDYNSAIRTVAVQPDSPLHGIEGTKHMASSITPGIYDAGIVDTTALVSTEDAHAMTRRLAREEGLLAGISSGANVHAALALARALPRGSVVATVLCDTGARYLSDSFWEAS